MMQAADEPQAASTLDELLALHDQQFVRCAYLTLFGRAADPQGLQYYTARLRAGHAKLGVLRQLCKSAEARTQAARLPGLQAALARYRRGQWPLMGIVFRWLEGTEGNSHAEREGRILRNQIHLVSEALRQHARQMETHCLAIDQAMVQLRHDSQLQFGDRDKAIAALRGELANLERWGDDVARQQATQQRDNKLRLDQTRESMSELGLKVDAGQRRFDEIEQALADLQDTLRRGAPLPAPLGPLALKSQRQLPAGARAVYGRLRKAFTQGVR